MLRDVKDYRFIMIHSLPSTDQTDWGLEILESSPAYLASNIVANAAALPRFMHKHHATRLPHRRGYGRDGERIDGSDVDQLDGWSRIGESQLGRQKWNEAWRGALQ